MSADAWNPKQYDKFKAERSQPFYDLMSLLETSHTPSQVVDLGCGTGELTADLHKHLKAQSTIGVDLSDEMLKKAQSLSVPGLQFIKGDIQTWKSATPVDVIFSNAALQWCTDHPKLFAELKSSLAPHGQIAVQMPMNHDYPTHTLADEMSREEPWKSLLKNEVYDKKKIMLTPEEYATLIFKLGFTEQKVLLKVYAHELENREAVVEWVKGTLLTRFKSRLSENDYQEFLRQYQSRLFKKIPDDKPFFYPFKRILIWAQL